MKKIAKFRSEKGFTGIDAGIAVLILILFTSVIATLYYQIFYKSTEIKRNSTASGYAIAIVEQIKKMYYSDIEIGTYNDKDITDEEGKKIRKILGIQLEAGYHAQVDVENYKPENAETFSDFVKKINVVVKFKLAGVDKSVSMDFIKAKEIVDIPNKPILKDNMSAVKYINGSYQVINPDETVWYNYEDKEYAYVYVKEKLSYGTKLTETQQSDLYMWIPRFAYNENNIVFLYDDTYRYRDRESNELLDISKLAKYELHDAFSSEECKKGFLTSKTYTDITGNVLTDLQKEAIDKITNGNYL